MAAVGYATLFCCARSFHENLRCAIGTSQQRGDGFALSFELARSRANLLEVVHRSPNEQHGLDSTK